MTALELLDGVQNSFEVMARAYAKQGKELRAHEAVTEAALAVVAYWGKGDDPDDNYPLIAALKEALAALSPFPPTPEQEGESE